VAVSFEEEEEERAAKAVKAAGKAAAGHEEDAELYCIVCKKKFRNHNQWRNHEQSKKHLERVAELRAELVMQDDDSLHEEPLDEVCMFFVPRLSFSSFSCCVHSTLWHLHGCGYSLCSSNTLSVSLTPTDVIGAGRAWGGPKWVSCAGY
jgi:hypothetical protein